MSRDRRFVGGSPWTACARPVDSRVIVRRNQITRLQDVVGTGLPVHTARVVYAGQHRGYPQSTALITAIDMHTSDIATKATDKTSRNPT